MLNARLFAGLAGIAFAVAILGRLRMLPRPNLWLTVGHVGFGAFYWQLSIFLTCAFFGFAYFGIARLTRHDLNLTTGMIAFLLVALASVVWLITSFVTDGSRLGDRLAIFLFAAMACFIVGVALSTVNLAWILLRFFLKQAKS